MFVETKPRPDIPTGYKIILSRIRMEKKTKKGVDKNAVLMYDKTNVRQGEKQWKKPFYT